MAYLDIVWEQYLDVKGQYGGQYVSRYCDFEADERKFNIWQ